MSQEELLDVLDESGAVIGVKSRAQVHADCDWHGLVFVWSAWNQDGQAVMMMQRRGRAGDRFIAQIDALAGGHIGSGETPAQSATRELLEEVGLRIAEEDLIELGTMRMERDHVDCQRVIEHLFLCPRPLTIEQLVTSDEVDGFVQVAVTDLINLIEARREQVKAQLRDADGVRVVELSRQAVAEYPPMILETFRQSLAAIDHYLRQGELDPTLIKG